MHGRAENIAAGENRCEEEEHNTVTRERWEIYAKMEGRRKGFEICESVNLFVHSIACGGRRSTVLPVVYGI